MKTAITALWVICGTLALTRLFGWNLDMVPWPPLPVSEWFADLYGAKNGDDIGELEFIYMLAVSFILVVAGTGLFCYLKRVLGRFTHS